MRFYTKQHKYYCGIDLHARSMYLCILDQSGAIVLHKNYRTSPQSLLRAVEPYREDIAIAVECIFTWYGGVFPARMHKPKFFAGSSFSQIRAEPDQVVSAQATLRQG